MSSINSGKHEREFAKDPERTNDAKRRHEPCRCVADLKNQRRSHAPWNPPADLRLILQNVAFPHAAGTVLPESAEFRDGTSYKQVLAHDHRNAIAGADQKNDMGHPQNYQPYGLVTKIGAISATPDCRPIVERKAAEMAAAERRW
jgi:hypothetical protein